MSPAWKLITCGRPIAELAKTYPISSAGDGIRLEVPAGVAPPSAASQALLSAVAPEDLVGKRVLDLGCGSGYLGLGLLLRGAALLWGSDNSSAAVACARRMAGRNSCAERAFFRRADLFREDPSGAPFDLVVTNPPRTPSGLIPADYAPRAAIDGGCWGDLFLLEIPRRARAYLAPEGVVYMPVSNVANPAGVKGRIAASYRNWEVVAQWEYPLKGYWLERGDVLADLAARGKAELLQRQGHPWGRVEILRCQFPKGRN